MVWSSKSSSPSPCGNEACTEQGPLAIRPLASNEELWWRAQPTGTGVCVTAFELQGNWSLTKVQPPFYTIPFPLPRKSVRSYPHPLVAVSLMVFLCSITVLLRNQQPPSRHTILAFLFFCRRGSKYLLYIFGDNPRLPRILFPHLLPVPSAPSTMRTILLHSCTPCYPFLHTRRSNPLPLPLPTATPSSWPPSSAPRTSQSCTSAARPLPLPWQLLPGLPRQQTPDHA